MEPRSGVTLKALTGLAALLYRLRAVSMAVALIAAVAFGVLVLDAETESTAALAALSVLLWAGLALGAAYLLVRPPPAVRPHDAWARRVRARVLAAAYWIAAAASLGLASFALILSFRALRLAFA